MQVLEKTSKPIRLFTFSKKDFFFSCFVQVFSKTCHFLLRTHHFTVFHVKNKLYVEIAEGFNLYTYAVETSE